jgi:hypothetical protein
MSQSLLNKTKAYFESTLKVNSPLKMSQESVNCNTIDIPEFTDEEIDL